MHAEFVLSGIFSLELTLRLVAYHPRAFLQVSLRRGGRGGGCGGEGE